MIPGAVASREIGTSTSSITGGDRWRRSVSESMRVIIVGGILAGVVLVGFGSRAAMFVLRITSPARVQGVTSDDGFVIGQVTLGGTYNLLQIGALVGIVGAVTYRLVAPWLIGPMWFRRATTGLAAAAVAGSGLVHADGVDFTLLQPTWLAIGLFVALPGLFGALIGPALDAASRPSSWTARGRRRWLLPLLTVACFPVTLPLLAIVALLLGCSAVGGGLQPVQRLRRSRPYGFAVRGVWLLIAMTGLIALVNDIGALT
jgi:hypothetical protein